LFNDHFAEQQVALIAATTASHARRTAAGSVSELDVVRCRHSAKLLRNAARSTNFSVFLLSA
jgi:hypothetical protein